MPRLVIRTSANMIVCQVVNFNPDGDKIVASASSRDLKKIGWNFHPGNLPSAYLAGLLLGQKAKKAAKSAVLDLGLQPSRRGSRIYAALKGVLDAGFTVPSSKECFPTPERTSGKHIEDYAKKLKENQELYKKQFSECIKNGAKPEELCSRFEELKKKILSM